MSNVLVPGSIVRERYRVEALIGQGGMGAVYRVADLRLPGRLCALKAMRIVVGAALVAETGAPDAVQEAARKQFLAEASILARLDQDNLPKVSDYFALDDYDCLVMDYVPGQDLQQCVQDARRQGHFLGEEQLVQWIHQLCDVLIYLHGQEPPIVHGDVKPANIKLTGDGRVKLVDFGLVRPAAADDPRTLTGSGLRGVGSLPYAALEQYAATARTDPRSDLYSLGATMYHLATNQAPASAHERFLDATALRAPRQINPALSAAFDRAILAAMQLHPKDRPASVAAWRQLLPGRPAPSGGETRRLTWREVLAANRWYALATLLLGLAALALTLLK